MAMGHGARPKNVLPLNTSMHGETKQRLLFAAGHAGQTRVTGVLGWSGECYQAGGDAWCGRRQCRRRVYGLLWTLINACRAAGWLLCLACGSGSQSGTGGGEASSRLLPLETQQTGQRGGLAGQQAGHGRPLCVQIACSCTGRTAGCARAVMTSTLRGRC